MMGPVTRYKKWRAERAMRQWAASPASMPARMSYYLHEGISADTPDAVTLAVWSGKHSECIWRRDVICVVKIGDTP